MLTVTGENLCVYLVAHTESVSWEFMQNSYSVLPGGEISIVTHSVTLLLRHRHMGRRNVLWEGIGGP